MIMILADYLALFPGASREKTRFMALAEALLSQVMDLMALTAEMPSGFSVENAEGIQLDAIGEVLGLRRESGMTDEAFRQYLLAKLMLWTWDGTNEGVPAVLPEGVTETDNGDMTVTVSSAGTDKALLPLPAGVGITE